MCHNDVTFSTIQLGRLAKPWKCNQQTERVECAREGEREEQGIGAERRKKAGEEWEVLGGQDTLAGAPGKPAVCPPTWEGLSTRAVEQGRPGPGTGR